MSRDGRLFDPDDVESDSSGESASIGSEPAPERTSSTADLEGEDHDGRLVTVVPDVGGLTQELTYRLPSSVDGDVAVGSMVLVDLGSRRVQGWIVELDVGIDSDLDLRDVRRVVSIGPPGDVVMLARWAAWRWSGRLAPVLKAASPPRRVPGRPPRRGPLASDSSATASGPDRRSAGLEGLAVDRLAAEALGRPAVTLVRIGPGADRLRFAVAAAALGDALVLTPTVGLARRLVARLDRVGIRHHLQPAQWAGGFTGGVVVGARSAVWSPVGELAAVVVLDEHEDAYKETRSPSWHARDVAIERARRAGVPCVLVSASPSIEAVEAADRELVESRGPMRRAWPTVEVVDRRLEDPVRGGLFPSTTVQRMRNAERVVAVLNRTGRAVMLACVTCGELARTADGEHLMAEVDGELVAAATGERRPVICAVCTGTKLKRLRLGVTRAAEELTALLRRPVHEVTATTDRSTIPGDAVVLGTSAVLFDTVPADLVVFLDFDQELLAPRVRAAEEAMALLARAGRLCRRPGGDTDRGGDGRGRIVVQTRDPDHRVVRAAVGADVGIFLDGEREIRQDSGWPPFAAMAELSGAGAFDYVQRLRAVMTEPVAGMASQRPETPPPAVVAVLGPRPDGRYLLRASDSETLASVLDRVERPRQRIRLVVDPLDL